MNDTNENMLPECDTTNMQSAKMTFSLADGGDDRPHERNSMGHLTAREGKYLTFSLANEEYGIGILKIKEIIGLMPITSVPRTPDYVRGVINLRGKVIPVIDLRLRFSMAQKEYTDRTCIVVVEIGGRAMDMIIGIVVDSVSEVLNIKNEDIEDTPAFGTSLNTEYILGMAKIDGSVKILLDIDTVLSSDEMALLSEAA
jgi:purine-binding chemotaxis protein CheW